MLSQYVQFHNCNKSLQPHHGLQTPRQLGSHTFHTARRCIPSGKYRQSFRGMCMKNMQGASSAWIQLTALMLTSTRLCSSLRYNTVLSTAICIYYLPITLYRRIYRPRAIVCLNIGTQAQTCLWKGIGNNKYVHHH